MSDDPAEVQMIRREFLTTALGATAASAALPLEAQISTLATGCGTFRLRYGVTQSGSYSLFDHLNDLAQMGFDYVEPTVTGAMALSDADFAATRAKSEAGRIHVESMNVLLPGDLKVVGPDVDHSKLDPYIQQSLGRANALGAKIVVFGSGGARKVPDGFSQDQAWGQLKQFLQFMGNEIDKHNYSFVIGIEALRKQESNIINTTADAYRLAVDSNHPKINIICDFFHLASENEDPKILQTVKDRLVHLHFANECNNRSFPRDVNECPQYAPFFANLRAINYQGRISIEAGTKDFVTDAPVGLGVLHKLYANACVS
jgi:D-psicose/D-tagatose/L-ribulose 3-epimerase